MLTSLARWNAPDNIEANKLNVSWEGFDIPTKSVVRNTFSGMIDKYYAICFTQSSESHKMWDEYGPCQGDDAGVRLAIDSDKLKDAVYRFWVSHVCVFAQTDNGASCDSLPIADLLEKINSTLLKFVKLEHVVYKADVQLDAERQVATTPEEVANEEIAVIAFDKMLSKAFEDETRLVMEFTCDLIEDFLPLQFDTLEIIQSYTINPRANDVQRTRVKNILAEFQESAKLKESILMEEAK